MVDDYVLVDPHMIDRVTLAISIVKYIAQASKI